MEINDNAQASRLVALDVFRGLTIAFMILVNTPGSWSHVYPYLLHAKWHGLMPADLVFPFFLFIIGVSMAFSFAKYQSEGNSSLVTKALKRTFLIFLIGLTINYFPFYNKSIDGLRIMGVLQRIALAYGVASIICLKTPQKHIWKMGILMLFGYWAFLFSFGSTSPYSLEGNISAEIDLYLLGANHIYKGFGIPFDPEGFLGTIPAAVSIMFGYLIGFKIKEKKSNLVKELVLMGALAILIGLLWNTMFPISKPLWTSSYVVFTFGIACVFLGILIQIIDVKKVDKWTRPFLVFGLNPMLLFVFSIIWVKILLYVVRWENEATQKVTTLYGWIYQNVFTSLFPDNLKFASLLFALTTVVLCWGLGYVLYSKKVVFKI